MQGRHSWHAGGPLLSITMLALMATQKPNPTFSMGSGAAQLARRRSLARHHDAGTDGDTETKPHMFNRRKGGTAGTPAVPCSAPRCWH